MTRWLEHRPLHQKVAGLWRAGPIKWQWSSQDSIKYIKQSGVTHVNQDGCQSAMTLWFKRENTYVRTDTSDKETHPRCLHMCSEEPCLQRPHIDSVLGNSTLVIRGVNQNSHISPIGSWQFPHWAAGMPRHLSKGPGSVECSTFKV